MGHQPQWRFLANLGDASPLDYGGYFVLVDDTGVYPAEGEFLVEPPDDDESGKYLVYRFTLDRCSYVDGVLSDNKHHRDMPAWLAEPEGKRAERPQDSTYLKNLADFVGQPVEKLVRMFCSEDPGERALAYHIVGDYHGFENLDGYPLQLTKAEVVERYTKLGVLKPKRVELPDHGPPGTATKADPLGDIFYEVPGGEG